MRPVNRLAAVLLSVCALAGAAEPPTAAVLASSLPPPGVLPESLRQEVNAAIDRALDWLAANQLPCGGWSNTNFPALTALPLRAFVRSERADRAAVVAKAVPFLLACVQPDGGIYRPRTDRKGGGLSNYNTAICITTLHALNDRRYDTVILNGRKLIAGSQHFGDDVYAGGFGYDATTKRAYTDLLNTYHAAQAMRLTADVEDRRPAGEERVDINWAETVKYIEKMQNKPETGPANAGGFVYNPSDPKAGATTNADGVVVFRSYGSITYAGMLALIYAQVDATDVRVRSAFDWAARHWTLEENPGMGQDGVYFFYNVLTKALNATGQDLVPLAEGGPLNWREAVARKLVGLQKVDARGRGYWQNESGRYWENDPVLTTSYTLLALQML